MTQLLEPATGTTDPDPDTGQFFERALGDAGAGLTILVAAIGDRLNLFKALAAGPMTAAELAARARISERFGTEWARAMTAAGYLEHADGRFGLPPARIPVLAEDESPVSAAGILGWVLAISPHLETIVGSVRSGSGVPMSAYGSDFARALARFSAPTYVNFLVSGWLPAAPAVHARLQAGVSVADIGCGAGRAVIELARAYPDSRFAGFDSSADQITLAREAAEQAGLSDRVRFDVVDARGGLPGRFDVITTFDVLHDSGEPLGLLRAIRSALRPGGSYLCAEPRSGATFEENLNPMGAIFYAVSVLFCLQVAVADGGPGLGTLGLPAPVLTDLCRQAGFDSVDELTVGDPLNSLFLVRP